MTKKKGIDFDDILGDSNEDDEPEEEHEKDEHSDESKNDVVFGDVTIDDDILEDKPPENLEDKKPTPTTTAFSNVGERSFHKLKELLGEQYWVDSKTLDRATCALIREVMEELEANDGNLALGKSSIDGFVMHNCPKHNNAPIHICVDCNFWKGGRKPSGTCNAPEDIEDNEEYDELEKYKYKEAKNKEITYRRENGRYFDS